MKDEISAAADFLTRLVGGKNDSLTKDKVDEFRQNIDDVLNDKFKNHWFPEKPNKGQAYRCIRINGNIRREPAIELVCKNIGIKYSDLMLPLELTLWIDPEDVTCRFGEHKGSYCTVLNLRDGNKENFVDQINVDELEQKALESAKQASFDMVNSRKRKARCNRTNGHHTSSNGLFNAVDYNNGLTTTTTSSSYYSPHGTFYGSSPKFGQSYGSPSHSLHQTPNSPMFSSNYSVSPPNRGVGTPYRGASTNYSAGANGLTTAYAGKFSRGLHTAFNNAASLSFGYNQQASVSDRYHWNKSVLKA